VRIFRGGSSVRAPGRGGRRGRPRAIWGCWYRGMLSWEWEGHGWVGGLGRMSW
jgi:hypothetical protein